MVIFLANLQSISPDLYEAAEIDGANGLKKIYVCNITINVSIGKNCNCYRIDWWNESI